MRVRVDVRREVRGDDVIGWYAAGALLMLVVLREVRLYMDHLDRTRRPQLDTQDRRRIGL